MVRNRGYRRVKRPHGNNEQTLPEYDRHSSYRHRNGHIREEGHRNANNEGSSHENLTNDYGSYGYDDNSYSNRYVSHSNRCESRSNEYSRSNDYSRSNEHQRNQDDCDPYPNDYELNAADEEEYEDERDFIRNTEKRFNDSDKDVNDNVRITISNDSHSRRFNASNRKVIVGRESSSFHDPAVSDEIRGRNDDREHPSNADHKSNNSNKHRLQSFSRHTSRRVYRAPHGKTFRTREEDSYNCSPEPSNSNYDTDWSSYANESKFIDPHRCNEGDRLSPKRDFWVHRRDPFEESECSPRGTPKSSRDLKRSNRDESCTRSSYEWNKSNGCLSSDNDYSHYDRSLVGKDRPGTSRQSHYREGSVTSEDRLSSGKFDCYNENSRDREMKLDQDRDRGDGLVGSFNYVRIPDEERASDQTVAYSYKDGRASESSVSGEIVYKLNQELSSDGLLHYELAFKEPSIDRGEFSSMAFRDKSDNPDRLYSAEEQYLRNTPSNVTIAYTHPFAYGDESNHTVRKTEDWRYGRDSVKSDVMRTDDAYGSPPEFTDVRKKGDYFSDDLLVQQHSALLDSNGNIIFDRQITKEDYGNRGGERELAAAEVRRLEDENVVYNDRYFENRGDFQDESEYKRSARYNQTTSARKSSAGFTSRMDQSCVELIVEGKHNSHGDASERRGGIYGETGERRRDIREKTDERRHDRDKYVQGHDVRGDTNARRHDTGGERVKRKDELCSSSNTVLTKRTKDASRINDNYDADQRVEKIVKSVENAGTSDISMTATLSNTGSKSPERRLGVRSRDRSRERSGGSTDPDKHVKEKLSRRQEDLRQMLINAGEESVTRYKKSRQAAALFASNFLPYVSQLAPMHAVQSLQSYVLPVHTLPQSPVVQSSLDIKNALGPIDLRQKKSKTKRIQVKRSNVPPKGVQRAIKDTSITLSNKEPCVVDLTKENESTNGETEKHACSRKRKPWFDQSCVNLRRKRQKKLVQLQSAYQEAHKSEKEISTLKENFREASRQYVSLIRERREVYLSKLEGEGNLLEICEEVVSSLVNKVVSYRKIEENGGDKAEDIINRRYSKSTTQNVIVINDSSEDET